MEKKIVPVPSIHSTPQTILNFLKFCVRSALPDVTDAQMKDVWDKLMINNDKIIERLGARKLELKKGSPSPEEEEYTRAIEQIQRLRIPIVSIEQVQKWKLGRAVTDDVGKVLRRLSSKASPLKTLSEDLLTALPLELLSHMDLSLADLIRLSRTSKELYDRIMADPSIQIEEKVIYIPEMKPWLKKLKNIRLEPENLSSLKDIVKAGKVSELDLDFNFQSNRLRDDRAKSLQELPLGNLPLYTLKIHNFPIHDISALANLKTLRVLDLSTTRVKELSALKNTPLRVLILYDTLVDDISTLDVSNLYSLDLSFADVKDISVLAGAHKLHTLNLNNTPVEDISTLNVSNLYSLDLSLTDIKDISVLAGAHKLHTLNLSSTPIDDISTLDVSNLYFLDLAFTDVKDISVLAGAHKLHTLDLSLIQVDNIDVLGNIPELYDLEIPNVVEDISALVNAHKLHSLRYNRDLDLIEPTLEKIPSLKIFKTGNRIYTRETNMWGTNYWKFKTDD